MKKISLKRWIMMDLRGYVKDYRKDGYIEEDVKIEVLYADGSILRYPDNAGEIRFRHILNVHIQTADDDQDFYHDAIVTPDQDIPDWADSLLVVEDMEDYYTGEFLRDLPEYWRHRAFIC